VQVPATVTPSGAYAVTVYEVMAEPPLPAALLAGAVKETVALPLSMVATGDVGALGTVAGVIGPAVEAVDVPVELVAVTENV
jgi:hypothetical protein